MSETSVTQPPGFTEMSKREQLRYLQDLWDQIAERPGELPVPKSHLDLAEARLKCYHENPTAAASAFDVLDRLARQRK
jgi:putative addiction module component (TIGR02574 family)